MKQLSRYEEIENYQTMDGSWIRELMHPAHHGNHNQSLAEATIPANTETQLHRHLNSEELYHITQGEGMMVLGQHSFPVQTGDTVQIPPGTPHKIINTGINDLKIFCCCSPAYSHDDTELL